LSELPVCITDSHATGNIAAEAGQAGGFLATFYSDGGAISNCYATGNIKAWQAGGFAYEITGTATIGVIFDAIGCYATGNVNAFGMGAGFAYELYGANIYRSYATGNVHGGGEAAGFIFATGSFGSDYIYVEECFSTGNVIIEKDMSGAISAGFIAYSVFSNIKNCYSKSDIYIIGVKGTSNMGGITVGGLTYSFDGDSADPLASGNFINCYYAGKIYILELLPEIERYAYGIADMIFFAQVVNCHWLKSDDGFAMSAVYSPHVYASSIDTMAYDDISEMYFLADVLNDGNNEQVWVNVVGSTPELSFVF
jgi:hypothetical protein